jgi:NTE family protein
MNPRVAVMMNKPCDKSVLKECYKPLDEHGPSAPVCHTNPLVPAEELGLHSACLFPNQQTSNKVLKNTRRIPPRCLAFCGGGIRCVSHIGVLKAMETAGLLKFVKEMIGISAGALFALLWVLEYSIKDIERLALELDFTVLQNIEPETALLFPLTYGIDSGEGIDKLLISVIKQKGLNPDITFKELSKKKPISFKCYATELQKSTQREFSVSVSPNVRVRTAIRASMSLPILFTPVEDPETKNLLVDGALLHNLPLVFLTEEQLKNTWGILFMTGEKIKPIESVVDFIKFIYDGGTLMRNITAIEKFKDKLIIININDYSPLNFKETKEARKRIIKEAENATTNYIYMKSSTRPVRRFSAC